MRKLLFVLLLTVISLTFQSSGHAQQQLDPAIEWKMLEEEHALWIYDSRHKDLVLQYSKNFQKIFPYLQKMFVEFPEKTTFVITDQTDMPNGSATVFPFPLVTIFPVIPIPTSPIGETNDSLFEILAHEYTHILNLHPVHGGMRGLSYIFGSVVRPNSMLPRWYVEGLAVFTESYFTPKGGRLRSQNFEGLVRAMSAKKSWPDYRIDQLNDFQPDWLGGRRAYLLGGAMMYEIAVNHGIDKIHELNQRYSRRLPFIINPPAWETLDRDYELLLKDTYQHLQEKADAQIQAISTAPVTTGQALPGQGNNSYRPRISPDGKYLAYVSGDQMMPTYVNLVTREPGKPFLTTSPKRIASGIGTEHIAWSNGSQFLAYNQIENYRRYYVYSDIYLFNINTGKAERLTKGARAGDMVFTTDDKALIFVQNTAGSKQISRLDLSTREHKPLYSPERFGTNLFGLTLKEDRLLFIEQTNEKRQMKALKLSTGAVELVNEKLTPTNMRNTAGGILYTSSISGVDNLYFSTDFTPETDSGGVKHVTNSLSRIYDGDIDPADQTLYYSEQKDKGIFIFASPKEEWSKITTAPKVPPLLSVPTPEALPAPTAVPPGTEMPTATVAKETEYSPLGYLIPRYWMPFAYVLDGGFSFSASTGVSDPLFKNTYNLMLEWDTLTQKTGASFAYANRSTPVELTASASQVYRYLYTTKSTLQDNSYSVGANFNVPFVQRSWTMGVNWKHSDTEFPTTLYHRSGPGAFISYGNAIQRGYQISPESGGGFSLAHQAYLESLGNIGYNKTNVNVRNYFSRWLPDRHVIFTQINGTYANDLKDPNFFTNSIGGNFFSNQLIPPFLIRGYPSGAILGNNMMSANLEYRFPIAYPYRGHGTWPAFLKTIYGAAVFDTASLDGYHFSSSRGRYKRGTFGDEWYSGFGAEINFDCTLGYYVPITFTFGVYRGINRDIATEGYSTFFAFRL
jgi:hypothetical protein